jgi:hypothetical protein
MCARLMPGSSLSTRSLVFFVAWVDCQSIVKHTRRAFAELILRELRELSERGREVSADPCSPDLPLGAPSSHHRSAECA